MKLQFILFFRQKITLLNAFLCFTTIVGIILVIQPNFIFSQTTFANEKVMTTNYTTGNKKVEKLYQTNNTFAKSSYTHRNGNSSNNNALDDAGSNAYFIGVSAAFAAAFTAGLAIVLSSKAKSCSNYLLMALVGLCTFLVGVMGPLFNLENRFLGKIETLDSFTEGKDNPLTTEIILTTGVAILSIVGVFLLIWASQIAPPIIVSLVRSCEILLGLLLEKVILVDFMKQNNDSNEKTLYLLIIGALFVLISVSTMAASDWLHTLINSLTSFKYTDRNSTNSQDAKELNASDRLLFEQNITCNGE